MLNLIKYKLSPQLSLKRIGLFASILFFCAAFLFAAILSFDASENILDADASSELVLSNLLASEGRILSPNWYYSTELRVVNTQLVYSLLFQVSNDWSLVRFLGSVILQALLVLSYGYMGKQIGLSWPKIFLTAGFVLLPTSVTYARFVLFHCYYTPNLILGFLIVGLLLSIRNHRQESILKKGIRIGAFALVCFLSGLGGVRQLLTTIAPLMAVSLYFFMGDARADQRGKSSIQKRIAPLLNPASGLLAAGAGYLINSLVLAKTYSFHVYNSLQIQYPTAARLDHLFQNWIHLFGFQTAYPAVSLGGILSVSSALCAVGILWAAWHNAHQAERDLTKERFLPAFFLTALVVNTLVFWIGEEFYQSYYLPVTVLAIPVIAVGLGETGLFSRWMRLFTGFFIIVLVANSIVTGQFLLTRPYDATIPYDGLAGYQNIHLVEDISCAEEFLEENGYTFGYATYWNANILTELSDGKIRSANLLYPEIGCREWLTRKDYRNMDGDVGEVFLLLTQKEYGEHPDNELMLAGEEVYQDDYYLIFSYESNQAVVDHFGR